MPTKSLRRDSSPPLFETGPVVELAAGFPFLGEGGEIVHQQVGDRPEILAAALGVGGLAIDEVGIGTLAWTFGVVVLAPEQEFDGVPAGSDVLLPAPLVLGDDVVAVDDEARIVDETHIGPALHRIYIGLVHGPGVDARLGALVVVDRAAVEAEGLGLAIELTGGAPCLLRSPLGLGRGGGEEGMDCLLQGLRRLQGSA